MSGPAAERLAFAPLHLADRLHPVNPTGDVGLLTLWSPLRTVQRKLDAISPAILDPARSRVAVVANLYGDGMFAMLCNLLHNPQVRHLVAIGEPLDLPTVAELRAFLADGLEDTTMLDRTLKRVRGTDRLFPDVPAFDAERLRETLTLTVLGRLSDPGLGPALQGALATLPRADPATIGARVTVDVADVAGGAAGADRVRQPSDVTAHQVVRRRPLDAWTELMVRVSRFGRPVELRSGPRLELLNVKVVLTEPAEESEASLARYGFRLDRFRSYQESILRPELPEGIAYTYGNRLRGHFPQATTPADTLRSVIDALRANPESRRGFVALWDTALDLPAGEDGDDTAAPCLTTLFFRRDDDRLALTATYRSHNLLTAWLQNVYGLLAIQRHVAAAVDLPPGPITVISHSLGIDPRNPRYALARTLDAGWKRDEDLDQDTGKYSLREDPNGYFVVTADRARGVVVAEHRYAGLLLKRYEGPRADHLLREIGGDLAVSLVSHALWLGHELARCEAELA